MDTIRYLLGAVIKLALGLLLVALVIWLVGILYPDFKVSKVFSGNAFKKDWLPAPKNYGGLLGNKNNSGENGTVYEPGPAYNGYPNTSAEGSANVDWVYYTATGTQVVRASGNTETTNVERSSYIRNLSVYQGATIAYGNTIVGEARDTMFKNGLFPIVVLDAQGRVIAAMDAINTGAWSTPGWVRFQTTVPVQLPRNTQCSLVFNSANQPVRVGMQVRCN